MKKNLLVSICLLLMAHLTLNAANRYWVGGTGSWNDPAHWSAISGGQGGAGVPSMSDDVFFDENAANSALTINISGIAQCNNLTVSESLGTAVLSGNNTAKLNIYGSLLFSSFVKNNFIGELVFKGTGTKSIDFRNAFPRGDVRFNGNALSTWSLSSDMIMNFDSKIIMEAGQLNTTGKNVQAFGVQWLGTAAKVLNIANSKLVFAQLIDETGTNNSSVIKSNTFIYPRASGGSRAIDSIQTVVTAPLCNNTADGCVTVTVFSSTSVGPYGFSWQGSPSCSPIPCTGNPLCGLGNGSYLLTVTDSSDFEVFQTFVSVIAPNPIGANFVKKRPKCNGDCNGTITATVVTGSGTAPYTYSWASSVPGFLPQTTPAITNLCAGTYSLTVRDAHNCTQTFIQVLNQPAVVAANATSTNISCFGVCDGTASSSPTGGNTPTTYSYAWTGPGGYSSTSQNPTNLCPGVYNVTVKDDSLCSGSGSVTITQPPILAITPSSTNITCNGANDGTATVSPVTGGTPGYTYTWTPVSAGSGPNVTNLSPGQYTVTVGDAKGCTQTATFNITQPAIFTVSMSGVDVSCLGGSNGSVTATVSGGTGPFTYAWNPGPTNGPVASASNTLSSQTAGTYNVTVTDVNGCSTSGTYTITEPPLLLANPVGTDILCFGQCNGSVISTPTGGTPPYSYSWAGTSTITTGQNTSTISNLCAGSYTVTVTDAKNCTSIQSVVLTEPTLLVLSISKTDVNCNGACDGTATVAATGGTPPYTYVWAGTGSTPTPYTGQGTAGITNLCPGSFTVTVTDANGCVKTASTSITQPNILNAYFNLSGATILCNGDTTASIGSVVSGGTPPYSFLWSPGNQTTSSISNIIAGTYTLTVTDAKGCVKVITTTITQPTVLNIVSSSTNVTCFGLCNGSASVIAGGGTPGYTYLWSPGGQTTSTVNGLCTGTYTVTVKDANNCTKTNTITITSPPQLSANPTLINNALCAGACNGSVYSAANGGLPPYTFDWSPNTITGDFNDTITSLCAGTYSILLTDAMGCTSTQSIAVTQPSVLGAPITGSTSSCNVCNGTATVSPTGGTPPYTFLWNDPSGQTTSTASGLCPNTTYMVTVKDANNCTASSLVTIAQTITIQITTSDTALSCAGVCDGIATANPSGGQPPYNYLWVGPGGTVGNSQTVMNLCPGSYTVTVVDANGCLNRDSVTFTDPPAILVTTTVTNASCGGLCNGSVTGAASGGTGSLTYSWNTTPLQTTATINSLCAGSYILSVTDGNGCIDTTLVSITEPTTIIDNVAITDANCLTANGTITVAPSGGTGPYNYSWGPGIITGQGTTTASSLLTGTYTLSIQDAAGCLANFSYIVNNINGPTLVMSNTNPSCNGVCNGTASVAASGGAPGYTYNWNGTFTGNLTPTISGLCGDQTYTVNVTDAAGCVTIDTATLIDPAPVSPNPVIVNETCGSLCNGSITLNPTGGSGTYTYSWTSSIPGLVLPPNSSQTGLCAGSYSVTVSDANGCDSTINITLTAPPTLLVTLSSTNVLCTGACNGTATANISGGLAPYSISWTGLPNLVLPNIVALCPNQYIVNVTDANNCVAKDTVVITQPTPLITSTSFVNATCNTLCDGIAIVTASGGTPGLGYNYSWSPGIIANNDTASGLCAGSYTVTVADSNGCTSTPGPITISQPGGIAANITVVNPLCNGSCDGTAMSSTSGGTPPYTYDWNGTPAGDGTSSVSGLCAGAHSVVISDSLGCAMLQNFSLVNPPSLNTASSTVSPTCQNSCNGSATAIPSGGTPGYTYLWTPGNATTQTVSNLCPGTYVLVVADTNNCKDTVNVTVVNPQGINISVSSTPASCGACDGTISVNPITGFAPYTYAWSPAPTVGQGTANASSVCAGLYSITVTDSAGCDSTFVLPMNNSGGPTGETISTVDATCNGFCNGSGSVVPLGGVPPFTYLWNNTPTPTANDTAINLCAGNYFVQVTDSNQCVHFSPVTINEPAPILSNAMIVQATCSNVCNGSISLFPSGGTPGAGGYSYVWTPAPPAGQNTSSISGLCSGTYSVTITDINGCTKVDSFAVGQSSPLNVTVASTNISCSNLCNGMAYVTISSGTPPFTIQWDDPAGQTNDTAMSLCAGVYTAVVSDFNGCITTVSVTITATPAVTLNATVTNANCGVCDGSAVAAPSGGTAPYTLSWSNGQSGSNVNNLCSGVYTVNVTDNAGCVSNFSVPVSNSNGPTNLAITSTNITCNGLSNGSVTGVTPSGGTAPYTYLWIPGGQTTPALSGLAAGAYYVQVTDNNGCSIVDSVLITEPPAIQANQVITAPTCGLSDGMIAISPSGGTGSYNIQWNIPSTNDTISNLSAGVYSVQITDGAGCSVNVVIPLSNLNGPGITMSSTNVSCNGVCNGTATASPGGFQSYVWNDASSQSTPTATGLCPGNYAVQVTASNGCVSVGTVTITEPSPIAFSVANTVNPLCNGDSTGSITTVTSGGTLPYAYSWSPSGGNAATASNLTAGSYTVTVTDAIGCSATQSTNLSQTNALVIASAVTNPSCSSLSDGAVDVTVTGGTSTYTYAWSGSSTATTEDITNLSGGTYIINVTDGNGCIIADTSILVPAQTVLVSAGSDTSFCLNGSFTLNAVSANASTFQWFVLPNTSIGNTASLTINPPAGSTTYYVLADNGSGCTASDTITLTSNVLPLADAGADVTIVVGASTTIGGNPTTVSGNSVLWNPLPGLDNATNLNPVATPSLTTTYAVSVTTPQGCTASDSMIVTVIPFIIIPDGISPNADGDNDEWIIDGIEQFPNCVVEVYNRWGELLFQSVGYKEHWKGTYKGKDLPVGSYYYVIDLKDPKFPDVYTGPITILR